MKKSVYMALAGVFFVSMFMVVFSGSGFAQGPAWMGATDDMPTAFIKAEDGNGDGKVAKDEFGGPDTMFEAWDKDKSGFIELSEAPTPEMLQGMGTPGGSAAGAQPGGDAMGGSPPAGGMPANFEKNPYVEGGVVGEAFIATMDGDKDGKVTHEEWEQAKMATAYKEKHWPEYDTNGDGFITVDEAPQLPAPGNLKLGE